MPLATIGTDDAAASHPALSTILAILHEQTGTDFSRYRSSTIVRRVLNRMVSIGAESFEGYLPLLRGRRDEALLLLGRLTIKVSRFYRNKATFDALRSDVVPALARSRGGEPIRCWSAGCGCGEEAFTLAMLLDDAGVSGTIEATDIDPGALEVARKGIYPASAFEELPVDLLERYCEPVDDDHYRIASFLRERVRFVRHDLTSEVPPRGYEVFDLVCCRNVLIYFKPDVQDAALRRVRQSIRSGGYLCLGEAEWPLPAVACSLVPLAHDTHVFRAAGRGLPGWPG